MEKITLKLFWICVVCCGSLAITGIWLQDKAPEILPRIMITFFIVGFANFLVWAPLMAYRFLNK